MGLILEMIPTDELACDVATLNRTHGLKYPKKSVSPNEPRKT